MTVDVHALAKKGGRSLAAANKLFEDGDYDFAVSRAYYAMFYLAEAALLSYGMTFSSHGAVISTFGREFVKPGHLEADLHKNLHDAFTERTVGDYDATQPYPLRPSRNDPCQCPQVRGQSSDVCSACRGATG